MCSLIDLKSHNVTLYSIHKPLHDVLKDVLYQLPCQKHKKYVIWELKYQKVHTHISIYYVILHSIHKLLKVLFFFTFSYLVNMLVHLVCGFGLKHELLLWFKPRDFYFTNFYHGNTIISIQVWCSFSTPEEALLHIMTDHHSPPRFR